MSPEAEKAIAAINELLENSGGRRLNAAEVLIVQSAWDNLEYSDVVEGTKYSLKYIGGASINKILELY